MSMARPGCMRAVATRGPATSSVSSPAAPSRSSPRSGAATTSDCSCPPERESAESLSAHRPPVRDGNRVELQVHLVGQVERHLLGALGLDHSAVLLEDRVLELLQ